LSRRAVSSYAPPFARRDRRARSRRGPRGVRQLAAAPQALDPNRGLWARRRGRRGSSASACETGPRTDRRSRPAVAWLRPTELRAGRLAETARLTRPSGRQGRRATNLDSPQRRHRHARRLAHVGIGALANAGDRGAVHQLAAAHKPLGVAIADGGPIGGAAADLANRRCETEPLRGGTLSDCGRMAAAHHAGTPGRKRQEWAVRRLAAAPRGDRRSRRGLARGPCECRPSAWRAHWRTSGSARWPLRETEGPSASLLPSTRPSGTANRRSWLVSARVWGITCCAHRSLRADGGSRPARSHGRRPRRSGRGVGRKRRG
jgi:hypothetical protein